MQKLQANKAYDLTPGLERLCARDWVRMAPWQSGIQRMEASFTGDAYTPHRHDTYAIGYTINGVQRFDYRGSQSDSMPGQIIVLHPDEVHNGEAGSDQGFHYHMLYVEPSLVRNALGPSQRTLPFVREAVLRDPRLLCAINAAFADMTVVLEPIALDEILTLLADGLLANDHCARGMVGILVDDKAVRLAREYLEVNAERTVASDELEGITGQNRYALARQFRSAYGTSPYRYLIMRRLDNVRAQIAQGQRLTDAAHSAGFSDQAHMTRHFKASYGISPGRWRNLNRKPQLISVHDTIVY